MADLNNKNSCPTLAEIEKFVKNPVLFRNKADL